MDEVYRKALNNQTIPFSYINDLKAIFKNCEKEFGATSAYMALAVSCFNYGIIIGKRQERSKHKKCSIK